MSAPIEFRPAERASTHARISLSGPSGSGKSYTALAMAHGFSDPDHGRIAVIDTERGSAAKYAGLNDWSFNTVTPHAFSPTSLIDLLAIAAGGGHDVVIIDSFSAYWSGVEGMLEQVDLHSRNGSNWSGWKEVRPDERRMLDALTSYPGHVIVTMRVKTEYVVDKDNEGKARVRKVGLRPDQRDNIEYEFDVGAEIDLDHTLSVSSTRIPPVAGAVVTKPGPEFAITIKDWLQEGKSVDGPLDYRRRALELVSDSDALRALWYEVRDAGLVNAPVTTAEGKPTTLGALIHACATSAQNPTATE